MFNIDTLFSPISWAEFVSDYFEQKHLLVSRSDRRYFDDVITLKEIDEILFSQKVNHPACRVIDSSTGSYPDPKRYTQNGTTTIRPAEFCREFSEGGTLAFGSMHWHSHKLRSFCNNLQRRFGHPFQTNLYLTPPEAKGFDPHYDNHDVVVLQIHGKKHWRLYESNMNLPDKSMPFEKEGFVPGDIFSEFVMEAGDVLYIPRGLVHDAYTSDDSSLHVTLGITGFTWGQLMLESIVKLTQEHQDFRHFVSEGLMGTDYQEQCEKLLALLSQDLEAKNGLARFAKQLDEQTPSEHIGHLQSLVEKPTELQMDAVEFSLNEGVELVLEEEKVAFVKGFKEVSFPAYCASTCRIILENRSSIKLDEVSSDLDSKGTAVLLSRLFREGFISKS